MSERSHEKSDIGGFSIVPDWLALAAEPAALKVWCVLASFANRDGMAFPSLATQCAMAKLSEKTVRRCHAELIALGAVTITPRVGVDGRQTSNAIYLHYVRGSKYAPPPPPGKNCQALNNTEEDAEAVVEPMVETATPHTDAEAATQQADALFAEWHLYHADSLVREIAAAIMEVPKFARHGMPVQAHVERLVADVREFAPDDGAVRYQLPAWVLYNQNQPKKGGQKDGVSALRNWLGKRRASWVLEKARKGGGNGHETRRQPSSIMTAAERARARIEKLQE